MKFVSTSFRIGLALVASFGLGVLPGCSDEESTVVVSESEATTGTGSEEKHDHEGHDHDHDGEEHDHDHDGKEHDHAGHDHDGDHEGHDHDGDHAGHDHNFKTIGAATAEITSLYAEIKAGMEKDDVDAAHDPLHHIGSVLVGAEDMLTAQGDKADPAVMKAVETLLDNFTKIDEGLHGEEGAKFSDVKDSIEEAIATLKKAGS